MNKLRWIYTYLCFFRILPAFICYKLNRFRDKCRMDLEAWVRHYEAPKNHSTFFQLGYVLIHEKETRNIFLNRLHRNPLVFVTVRVLFKPLESCYIHMPPEHIGGGLVLQHGFSTIIAAQRIGANCKIFQQVTVGYNGDKSPVIGDRVQISAGAIVVGDVTGADDVVIGAGAVVVRSCNTSGATLVGVPAKVVGSEKN